MKIGEVLSRLSCGVRNFEVAHRSRIMDLCEEDPELKEEHDKSYKENKTFVPIAEAEAYAATRILGKMTEEYHTILETLVKNNPDIEGIELI